MSYKPLATAIYIEHQLLEGSLQLAVNTLRRVRDGEQVEVEKVLAQLESARASVREFADEVHDKLLRNRPVTKH